MRAACGSAPAATARTRVRARAVGLLGRHLAKSRWPMMECGGIVGRQGPTPCGQVRGNSRASARIVRVCANPCDNRLLMHDVRGFRLASLGVAAVHERADRTGPCSAQQPCSDRHRHRHHPRHCGGGLVAGGVGRIHAARLRGAGPGGNLRHHDAQVECFHAPQSRPVTRHQRLCHGGRVRRHVHPVRRATYRRV